MLVIFYLTASLSQLRYFCYFLISRRDGENNGFLAGVPLLPPPSRVVSRPNSLPLPFRTPATQARFIFKDLQTQVIYFCSTPHNYILSQKLRTAAVAAAWLAQLGERRSAERKVAGSNPGRTNI